MANVVDFNMMVAINELLKNKDIEYSIHAVGGCTCAGLRLRQDGNEYPIEDILKIINDYLGSKWMKVIPKENDSLLLDIVSKFPHEK